MTLATSKSCLGRINNSKRSLMSSEFPDTDESFQITVSNLLAMKFSFLRLFSMNCSNINNKLYSCASSLHCQVTFRKSFHVQTSARVNISQMDFVLSYESHFAYLNLYLYTSNS